MANQQVLSQQGKLVTQHGSSGSLVVDALQARLRLQRATSRQNSGEPAGLACPSAVLPVCNHSRRVAADTVTILSRRVLSPYPWTSNMLSSQKQSKARKVQLHVWLLAGRLARIINGHSCSVQEGPARLGSSLPGPAPPGSLLAACQLPAIGTALCASFSTQALTSVSSFLPQVMATHEPMRPLQAFKLTCTFTLAGIQCFWPPGSPSMAIICSILHPCATSSIIRVHLSTFLPWQLITESQSHKTPTM